MSFFKLLKIIQNAIPFLSQEWKEKYALFLEAEHINNFVIHLQHYLDNGLSSATRLPTFKEEVITNQYLSFSLFDQALKMIKEGDFENTIDAQREIVDTIQQIDFSHILLIIGQRLTPASIQGENAIPPLKETLLKSCFEKYNEHISVATRAWEKHVGRNEHQFWGEVKGNPQKKEQKVKELIYYILENKTWWNVFFHYKHSYVYEVRVSSGHGLRWTQKGERFVGFLEHFLD